jgi:hypothetical protein
LHNSPRIPRPHYASTCPRPEEEDRERKREEQSSNCRITGKEGAAKEKERTDNHNVCLSNQRSIASSEIHPIHRVESQKHCTTPKKKELREHTRSHRNNKHVYLISTTVVSSLIHSRKKRP